MLTCQFPRAVGDLKFAFVVLRSVCVIMNEYVVAAIINTSNIGENGGVGLISSFTAAIIVCELDDLMT